MTRALAEQVFDILIEEVGVSQAYREDFIRAQRDGCREYRLGGWLGFGGKFWSERFAVSCYPEDLTPERGDIIARANARLQGLRGGQ